MQGQDLRCIHICTSISRIPSRRSASSYQEVHAAAVAAVRSEDEAGFEFAVEVGVAAASVGVDAIVRHVGLGLLSTRWGALLLGAVSLVRGWLPGASAA